MLVPGATFPDLRLHDHNGSERALSELVGDDPTVLHTYRGFWCPKEQAFFRRLVALQADLEVAYARIVSLSIDSPRVAAALRAGLGARWTFLSDPDRVALGELDLVETTDTTNRPYLPTVFTLHPDLRIETRYDGYWYLGRPTNDELMRDLRAVAAAHRAALP